MTKEEKKKLIKECKQAGLTDEKLIAAVLGGMSIEEALKGQQANQGGPFEQGSGEENLAGKESGEAPGSSSEGAAQENKPSSDSSKDSEQDASKEEDEKVYKLNCNLHHNERYFAKGDPVSSKDKDFEDLKEFGFLN